jgi:hypothetical protein
MNYKHPYPRIFEDAGFDILSRHLGEALPGKVKLLMTARRK